MFNTIIIATEFGLHKMNVPKNLTNQDVGKYIEVYMPKNWAKSDIQCWMYVENIAYLPNGEIVH